MKPTTFALYHPKYLLTIACGLILILGACASADPHQLSDTKGTEDPSPRSFLSSLFDTVKSWTDSAEIKDSRKASGVRDSEGLANKLSSDEPLHVAAKASLLSIIELEAKKAQALKDQRNGNPCKNCVDDGNGNLLPPNLIQSIQVQKTRSPLDRSQLESNDNGEAIKSNFHDQNNYEMLSDNSSEDAPSNTKSKLRLNNGFVASSQRRQLSKSKNSIGIVNPGLPFPTNCRCEYPSERIYTFVNQPINQFRDGILILPRSSIYCLSVDFICPDDDPPTGSVRFTCPNFNTGVIVNNKGKGKGNKNGNAILGTGVVGGVGVVGNGFGFTNLGGKSKCGKGKGNKGINNCGVIIPPQVPSHPQFEVLPASDPDCRDTPTPRPIDPSPPIPTPDASPPRCKDEYDDWYECVNSSRGCANCEPIPNEPGGWLNRREECNVFEGWFPINYACCPPCTDELEEFEFCKDCSLPSPVRPPTPNRGPPNTPRPSPPRNRPTPRPTPRRNRPTPRPTPRRNNPPTRRPPATRSSSSGSGSNGASNGKGSDDVSVSGAGERRRVIDDSGGDSGDS